MFHCFKICQNETIASLVPGCFSCLETNHTFLFVEWKSNKESCSRPTFSSCSRKSAEMIAKLLVILSLALAFCNADNVVDLTASNFDSVALDSKKDVLVEFYAPCKYGPRQ